MHPCANVLLLGNGGREHALAKAIMRSKKQKKLFGFFSAHNPKIIELCEQYYHTEEKNFGAETHWQTLIEMANKWNITHAIIGPDDPIAAGATDALQTIGVKVLAPTKKCAQLESSKGFTRSIVEKYTIDGNPIFKRFNTENKHEIEEYLKNLPYAFVIKDDGLCGGKGVFVQKDHFQNTEEGIIIAKNILNTKNGGLVIEEKLEGPEFSLMFFVDGNTAVAMPAIADHKRAFENDEGPNTGGMGTISFPDILPFITEQNIQEATDITNAVMHALSTELGEKFCGIMYGGFMRTKNGTKLIEYNARFGDPEALNALPLLETDIIDIIDHATSGTLATLPITFQKKYTVCKYAVPEGYPNTPIKNKVLEIDPAKIPAGVEIFYASVYQKNNELLLGGSRAVAMVAIADDPISAFEKAEAAMQAISGPIFWRKDIGSPELLEKRMKEVVF